MRWISSTESKPLRHGVQSTVGVSSGVGGNDFVASWTEDAGAVLVVDADATLIDSDENLVLINIYISNPQDGADGVGQDDVEWHVEAQPDQDPNATQSTHSQHDAQAAACHTAPSMRAAVTLLSNTPIEVSARVPSPVTTTLRLATFPPLSRALRR